MYGRYKQMHIHLILMQNDSVHYLRQSPPLMDVNICDEYLGMDVLVTGLLFKLLTITKLDYIHYTCVHSFEHFMFSFSIVHLFNTSDFDSFIHSMVVVRVVTWLGLTCESVNKRVWQAFFRVYVSDCKCFMRLITFSMNFYNFFFYNITQVRRLIQILARRPE